MQHPLMELCLVLQAKEVHIHELSIKFQNFAVLFSCKAFGIGLILLMFLRTSGSISSISSLHFLR